MGRRRCARRPATVGGGPALPAVALAGGHLLRYVPLRGRTVRLLRGRSLRGRPGRRVIPGHYRFGGLTGLQQLVLVDRLDEALSQTHVALDPYLAEHERRHGVEPALDHLEQVVLAHLDDDVRLVRYALDRTDGATLHDVVDGLLHVELDDGVR